MNGRGTNAGAGSRTAAPRRLSRDIAGVFGTRAAWSAMSVISGVLLARWLGPHDRGVLALVLLVPATVTTLVKLGIMQANIYYINREHVPAERVASNSLVLALVSGLGAVAVVWLLRGVLQATVLRDVPTWALVLALVRVPLLLIDNYLYSVLQATGRFATYNVRLLLNDALRLALVVVFVVVLGFGLPAAVASYSFVGFVMVVWLTTAVGRDIPLSLRLDRDLLAKQLNFGVRSWIQTLTSHLLLRVDIYMVAYFLSPSETGFYALALHFTELVLEFPQAVGLVLYPKLASSPIEEVHRLTAQSCRRTLLVTVPTALGLALVGPFLIRLWYGEPFAPAGAPLPWAAVGVITMSIFVILTRDFTSRGEQRVNIISGLLALVLNVTLNLYMIPTYGIVGAAVATALSYSGACIVLLIFYVFETGISPIDVLVPKWSDIEFFWEQTRRALMHGRRLVGLGLARAND